MMFGFVVAMSEETCAAPLVHWPCVQKQARGSGCDWMRIYDRLLHHLTEQGAEFRFDQRLDR